MTAAVAGGRRAPAGVLPRVSRRAHRAQGGPAARRSTGWRRWPTSTTSACWPRATRCSSGWAGAGRSASWAPSTSRCCPSRAPCSGRSPGSGLRWDDADFLSLHGRAARGVPHPPAPHAPSWRCSPTPTNSPPALAAAHARARPDRLGAPGCARTWAARASGCAASPSRSWRPAPDVGAAQRAASWCATIPAWRPPPAIPFLHEDAFAKRMPKKGLITKREVRLLSLAALGIRARQRGLGHRRRLGLGRDRGGPAGARGAGLRRRGGPRRRRDLPGQRRAPTRWTTSRWWPGARPRRWPTSRRPTPCSWAAARAAWTRSSTSPWQRLRPGGRLVVNAITLENTAEAYQALQAARAGARGDAAAGRRAREPAGALPALRGAEPDPDLRRHQGGRLRERSRHERYGKLLRRGRRPRRARSASPSARSGSCARARCWSCRGPTTTAARWPGGSPGRWWARCPGRSGCSSPSRCARIPTLLRPAWERPSSQIGERLERGLSVAFVTEGDPSRLQHLHLPGARGAPPLARRRRSRWSRASPR